MIVLQLIHFFLVFLVRLRWDLLVFDADWAEPVVSTPRAELPAVLAHPNVAAPENTNQSVSELISDKIPRNQHLQGSSVIDYILWFVW